MKTIDSQASYVDLCNAVQIRSGLDPAMAFAVTKHVLMCLEHPVMVATAEDSAAIEAAAATDNGIESWLDANPNRHVAIANVYPEIWSIYQDTINLRNTMKRLREQQFPKKV